MSDVFDTEFGNVMVASSVDADCKGKVVPVLLTEHHPMKTYWGVEV
jgi:hypothetical protein